MCEFWGDIIQLVTTEDKTKVGGTEEMPEHPGAEVGAEQS